MSAFVFFLLAVAVSASPASIPTRFLKPASFRRPSPVVPQEYFELTRPLPPDVDRPSCAHPILRHSFANTINSPPYTVPYTPPDNSSACDAPWSSVILEISASCRGDQYDRISALWLGGAELIRTSTAEPTADGIFWKVRKDVTRYSWLFSQLDLNATMMLENIVNDEFTGVYHVNATLFFYKEADVNAPLSLPSQKHNLGLGAWDFYGPPANLIIPISSSGDRGFWFRIDGESDTHSRRISIPTNTKQAVLELHVSFHGNDEFWYSNPPDSYIRANNLTTGRGNGAYREVFVTIDGRLVGSEVPFPVVFTGGINPLFWEPVVAIGAFDLPTYDIDLTPMLGFLLDGKSHDFSIGVTSGISYWLVGANLHLWVDQRPVQAKAVLYDAPALRLKQRSQFKQLDGTFQIEARRKVRVSGWVKSNSGNLTTTITKQYRIKNSIRFRTNGTESLSKVVKQRVKARRETRIKNELGATVARSVFKRTYPLKVITITLPRTNDTYKLITNVSHALKEQFWSGELSSSVHNEQVSDGWMLVKDHEVLNGTAITNQTYSYQDELVCYFRSIAAKNGTLIQDNSTSLCSPPS